MYLTLYPIEIEKGFPVTLFRKSPEADGQCYTGLQLNKRRNAGRPDRHSKRQKRVGKILQEF